MLSSQDNKTIEIKVALFTFLNKKIKNDRIYLTKTLVLTSPLRIDLNSKYLQIQAVKKLVKQLLLAQVFHRKKNLSYLRDQTNSEYSHFQKQQPSNWTGSIKVKKPFLR